jgi:integrase
MASFKKRPSKKWPAGVQATVEIKGSPPRSETLRNMQEARRWAAEVETEIRAGLAGKFPNKTVDDALKRYEDEVSAHKRGGDKEALRFSALRREFPKLVGKVMHKTTAADWSDWRDRRLKVVTKGSVQRDINLFRNVWSIAAKEWHWCAEPSPFRAMRLPGDNPARERVVRWQEARLLLRRMGYVTGRPPADKTGELAYLFLLAMGTGMRTSELLGLTATTLDLQRRVARLDVHKTVEKAGVRHVPIPRRAARVFATLAAGKTGALFTLTADTADTLFRKCRDQCMIEGLTFRDTRATALTLLAKRVEVMVLARISGHLDLKQLLKTYYRATAEEIAADI